MSGAYMVGRYHDGERALCVLYRAGRKHLHLTFRDDSGIRHATAPLQDARYIAPLLHKGAAYPVARMVRQLRAIGAHAGITEAARAELQGAAV